VVPQHVLVLNASYEPINVCSIRRALVLLLKEKAEILEHAARPVRGVGRDFATPHVIRLVYRVKVPRYEARRMSRRALFARDGYERAFSKFTLATVADQYLSVLGDVQNEQGHVNVS
jgi:5-methylcytosine-specific restriction endonuclease McrA